jgi:hypothetical protein
MREAAARRKKKPSVAKRPEGLNPPDEGGGDKQMSLDVNAFAACRPIMFAIELIT